VTAAPEGRLAGELGDDELVLLFACCHPAMPVAQQVALALRLFTALELAPLAQVPLCTEAALAQCLARAREALAGVARATPRRDAVLTVLSLAFHAGARARARGQAAGITLCTDTLRLARALAAHPAVAHPDADALTALVVR